MEEQCHCETCNITFGTRRAYVRHLRGTRAHPVDKPIICSTCGATFQRKDIHDRHVERGNCRPQTKIAGAGPTRLGGQLGASDSDVRTGIGFDFDPNLDPQSGFDFDFDLDLQLNFDRDTDVGSNSGDYGHAEQRIGEAPGFGNMDWEFTALSHDEDPMQICDIGPGRDDTLSEMDMMPELTMAASTEGSEISSAEAVGNERGADIGLAVTASDDTPVIQLYSLPFRPAKPSKTRLAKFGTKCTVCGERYESNSEALHQHLEKHFKEQQGEYLCKRCDVGFVHRKDFEHHLARAKHGNGGFAFDHNIKGKATQGKEGEEPKEPFSADDKYKMAVLARTWEHSQLQLQVSSIQRLRQLRQAASSSFSRISLPEIVRSQRNSLASLVFSLHSFRSDPRASFCSHGHEIDTGEPDTEQRSPTASLRQYRQRRRRLQEIKAASEELGPAASSGNFEAVLKLLGKGANPDHPSRSGRIRHISPLLHAGVGRRRNIVQLLLVHGAAATTCDSSGRTPLSAAPDNNDVGMAETLLGYGAFSNATDNGVSVLSNSIAQGRLAFVRLLLHEWTKLNGGPKTVERCSPSSHRSRPR